MEKSTMSGKLAFHDAFAYAMLNFAGRAFIVHLLIIETCQEEI
jgi:hypothetical protein